MSTHDDRSDQPRSVTRRRALGRLLGLAGAAAVAATLPAEAGAQPVSSMLDAPPVAALPDWLADRPEWFLASVERYAAALATLRDPLGAYGKLAVTETRAESLAFWTECMVAGMNVPEAEREAERRAWREEWASTPKEVDQSRIITVRIRRLGRNERARLRRWLVTLPAGERDPRVVYRLGWRDRVHGERDHDFLHVVAPARRSIFDPSPIEHAGAVLGGASRAAGLAAVGEPPTYTFGCAHHAPMESWVARTLYEWPDGEVTTYAVRHGPADAA